MFEPTIKTNFAEFKELAADFFRGLPEANDEEAGARYKCLSIAFLGMDADNELEEHQATEIMKMASAKMGERDFLSHF